MHGHAVSLAIPADAGYVALLRTLVGACAGRDGFTVEQIDDVKMAVEEAAVQLLRAIEGDQLLCEVTRTTAGIEIVVTAELAAGRTPIDETSFSWMILHALADEVDLRRAERSATVVLRKARTVTDVPGGASGGSA